MSRARYQPTPPFVVFLYILYTVVGTALVFHAVATYNVEHAVQGELDRKIDTSQMQYMRALQEKCGGQEATPRPARGGYNCYDTNGRFTRFIPKEKMQ